MLFGGKKCIAESCGVVTEAAAGCDNSALLWQSLQDAFNGSWRRWVQHLLSFVTLALRFEKEEQVLFRCVSWFCLASRFV